MGSARHGGEGGHHLPELQHPGGSVRVRRVGAVRDPPVDGVVPLGSETDTTRTQTDTEMDMTSNSDTYGQILHGFARDGQRRCGRQKKGERAEEIGRAQHVLLRRLLPRVAPPVVRVLILHLAHRLLLVLTLRRQPVQPAPGPLPLPAVLVDAPEVVGWE